MMRTIRNAVQMVALAGLFVTAEALAASSQSNPVPAPPATASSALGNVYLGDYAASPDSLFATPQVYLGDYLQVAQLQATQPGAEQSAALPVGTIRLRVIPSIGGATVDEAIDWQITTFGRDAAGTRKTVAHVTGATPELVLPAGWYVVHARLADRTIKHPVEVTAGRTFKYTLVKN